MSTCSNCGALYPPDDTACPECGVENDRSGLRNRVDSRSVDSKVDEAVADRNSGSAVDPEHAADERRSRRDSSRVRASEIEADEKLEKTTKAEYPQSDIPETNSHEPITTVDGESRRAKKPTTRDEDPAAISEPRPAREREAENRESDTDGAAAIDESQSATQDEVLPPAYGSDALAAAAEMERATVEDQPQDFSEESELSASPSDSEVQEERNRAVAQTDPERQTDKPRSSSSSDSIPPPKEETAEEAPVPVRPPVLASEALREQLAPAEPGRDVIRVLSVVVGTVGTLSMIALLGTSGMGLPLAGAFLALTAFALPSIPYAPRAAAVFTISASTLGVITWMYVGTVGTPAEIVETIGVVTLGVALQFRAWHRASIVARILVAVGILVCIGWLGMSGWLKDFTTLDPAWQSWLPTIIRAPFGLLLMLSLLAFMDARTTGGCGAWATAVMLWHALHMTVQLMILVWPKESRVPN